MHLTIISDTHSQHQKLQLGSGDILIHCGDFTNCGSLDDTVSFTDFMAEQKFKHKIVIAGNHDFCFEDKRSREAEKLLRDNDIIYLNDTGIQIDGINFWGSPVQPEFMNWAFNRARGADIRKHWDKIHASTDVLITHGPPLGILDVTFDGRSVGCADLLDSVQNIKPRVHAFGHIHESYGVVELDDIKFVNACNTDHSYRITHPPVRVEI